MVNNATMILLTALVAISLIEEIATSAVSS